jgi:hypothetical protein
VGVNSRRKKGINSLTYLDHHEGTEYLDMLSLEDATGSWIQASFLQRLLYELQRTRLSPSRMMAPPPSPVCKLDRRHTGSLSKRYELLTSDGTWEGVVEEPSQYTARKPGPQ